MASWMAEAGIVQIPWKRILDCAPYQRLANDARIERRWANLLVTAEDDYRNEVSKFGWSADRQLNFSGHVPTVSGDHNTDNWIWPKSNIYPETRFIEVQAKNKKLDKQISDDIAYEKQVARYVAQQRADRISDIERTRKKIEADKATADSYARCLTKHRDAAVFIAKRVCYAKVTKSNVADYPVQPNSLAGVYREFGLLLPHSPIGDIGGLNLGAICEIARIVVENAALSIDEISAKVDKWVGDTLARLEQNAETQAAT